jgi:hypothetical protein
VTDPSSVTDKYVEARGRRDDEKDAGDDEEGEAGRRGGVLDLYEKKETRTEGEQDFLKRRKKTQRNSNTERRARRRRRRRRRRTERLPLHCNFTN